MSSTPLVSVIIPTYNSGRFVAQAVQSALNQTYRSVEIIVVDDGSTDDTAESLKSYGDRICYIKQPNSGPAVARNAGIRRARGELLSFLDADDFWDTRRLEVQVAHLLAHPNIGLVHTDMTYCDQDGKNHFDLQRPRSQFTGNCYRQLFFCNHIAPSAVLLRKEIIVDSGSFDEVSDIRGCEDYDLWLRIARKHEFAYLPQRLTIYRLHADNMSRNELRMAVSILNVVLKSLKADPTWESIVGSANIRKRLYDLYAQIGYCYWNVGELVTARRYLKEALSLQPLSSYVGSLWGATYLPANLVRLARKLKQSVVQRLQVKYQSY